MSADNQIENTPSSALNGTDSRFRRISRITLAVMIYGIGGTLCCICGAGLAGVLGFGKVAQFLVYPLTGCFLAFFLGVLAYVLLICFGAMRITLLSLFVSVLALGFSGVCIASESTALFVVGLVPLAVLAQYWVYQFFKASYEQDRRDGII